MRITSIMCSFCIRLFLVVYLLIVETKNSKTIYFKKETKKINLFAKN